MNKFNLIENANDSLEHALKHMGSIENDGLGNWKRIILDLAHVIELLFKEKLRKIHPAFVFKNIDTYPSTTAHTVSSDLARKRLEKIGEINFSKDALKAITTAREKRNQIEHFEFSISEREANVLIGQVLLFIFDFSDRQLSLGWESLHLREKKHPEFKKYTEFYNKYLKEAEVQIEEDEIDVIECSSCHNMSFDVDKETCLVCSHHEDVLDCNSCSSPYIFSSCEYDESAGLCPNCESEDGYALANYEKY